MADHDRPKAQGGAAAPSPVGRRKRPRPASNGDEPREPEAASRSRGTLPRKQVARKTQRAGSMMTAEQNNEAPAKLCSACEKKSDALKMCTACKCVWYCDKECKSAHSAEHEHECRRIQKELDQRGGKLDLGEELDIGPLEKLPQREECPICMLALPIDAGLQTYNACCGNTTCCACDYQHQTKCREQAVPPNCAFCRAAAARSDEEVLAQIRKRVERKDPNALHNMAMHHGEGDLGLPVNHTKCIELLCESAGLGFPSAQYQLGAFHFTGEMGLEQNEEEASKNYKEAAESGHLIALHNLGCAEEESGDDAAAMRHWRLAASGGYKASMERLIICFEDGDLKHGDLAETLQTHYRSRSELKSEGRDQYIKVLKQTGEYKEEHDM